MDTICGVVRIKKQESMLEILHILSAFYGQWEWNNRWNGSTDDDDDHCRFVREILENLLRFAMNQLFYL